MMKLVKLMLDIYRNIYYDKIRKRFHFDKFGYILDRGEYDRLRQIKRTISGR